MLGTHDVAMKLVRFASAPSFQQHCNMDKSANHGLAEEVRGYIQMETVRSANPRSKDGCIKDKTAIIIPMFEYNKSNHFKPEPIIITPLTWTYEIATETLSEVMKHSVSMLLIHFGVNIETRVAELSYLLGKQFHSLRRIAEYYRLIYLQLLNDNTTIKLNQHDITGIHERRYTHWQDENWDESLNDDTW